ncbi:MAG: hypothetical protein K8L97_12465 [Anaerolineae bacterium]|nr:hypothetical protein [Anaerolineae bacterium]
MSENVFAEDWLDCLRSHYMHVIRTNDRVTLPSLTIVMGQAGFNESELAELRVRATMHVDDIGADFVPDMDVLESVSQVETEDESSVFAVPEIVAEMTELSPETGMVVADESVAELLIEPESALDDFPEESPLDDDAPKQLSLF